MYNHLKLLKEEYSMEKIKHLKDTDIRYMQGYMKRASIEDPRLEFRYRVGMLDNRANMGKHYKYKKCPHCPAGREDQVVESSQHWMTCQAYVELRRGLDPETNLSDRIKYIRSVCVLLRFTQGFFISSFGSFFSPLSKSQKTLGKKD